MTTAILPDGEKDRLVLPDEAAHLLATTEQTLRHWRTTGFGPTPIKRGRRITYLLSDVWRFIHEQRAAAEADRP